MSGLTLRRYLDTLRGLHPEQIRYQILRKLPATGAGDPAGLPPGPVPERAGWGTRMPRCQAPADQGLLTGRFASWGVERALDLRHRWEAPDLGRSWNYPVHYFDAAPGLASEARARGDTALRDALCGVLVQWIEAHPTGTSVGWEPYPTALRIVNWLDTLQVLGEWCDHESRDRILRSVYVQAGWLEHRLERHLLGTHLLKDAKALVFAGRVFADAAGSRWRRSGEAVLAHQIPEQIHPDGGHLEPSVLYHGVALEDILDLANLGAEAAELRALVTDAAARMVAFLSAVLPPDSGWPLLGDAARDATPTPGELLAYARRLGFEVPAPRHGLRFLGDSRLAVYRDARQYLLADVGPIGPSHLSGHGHCDSLSFEWFVGGLPLVVDSGTRTYEPGPERDASRGTAAHNTLEIDGRPQHEVWAAFRVARRSDVEAHAEDGAVECRLVPWHDRRLQVVRRLEPSTAGVRLLDRLEGVGRHRVASRFHLHPDCSAEVRGPVVHVRRGTVSARIVIPDTAFELLTADRSDSLCCESFGVARPNAVIRMDRDVDLPWTCEVRLEIDGG